MIRGIEIFRNYFRDYKDQYVLIGGSACDLIFTEVGIEFRATKDLDLVLIVEALTSEFGKRIWAFIREGGYQNRQRASGNAQYYRFDKPLNREYPFMIELFPRTQSLLISPDSTTVPIHIDDDVSSLSAILLDQDYYRLLLEGRGLVSDIVVLKSEYLIVFKAKAYSDLKARREAQGLPANEEVKKHLKDIVRLAILLTGNERPPLTDTIKRDMERFIEQFEQEPYDPRQLELRITIKQLLKALHAVYLSE